MKSIKLIALTLVIVLVAFLFVSCVEPVQTPEETLTPAITSTPEPTDDPRKQALSDANEALSAYRAYSIESGTAFVVEKQGKWYWFIYEGDALVNGEISNTPPEAPEGMVLETDETNLYLVPENVTIYILESMVNPQRAAHSNARSALSTYLSNTASSATGANLIDGTVFIVEKQDKWYSFIFDMGKLEPGETYDTEPETPDGLVLETNEANLSDIPENITIYLPKP